MQSKEEHVGRTVSSTKESEEELRIAKKRLSPRTINIPNEQDDIEQLLQASSEEVNLIDMFQNAGAPDFDPPHQGNQLHFKVHSNQVQLPLLCYRRRRLLP